MAALTVANVETIALDVDGTIADTDPIHASAWSLALRDVTGHRFSVEEYLATCIDGAMSPRDFMSGLATPEEWLLIERAKRKIYPSMLRAEGSVTPGLSGLLTQARQAAVRIAIVSSSSRESVDAMLAEMWPGPAPEVVVSRRRGLAPKPDPAPYLLALELLGAAPAQTVAFEDSASGVASAQAARVVCIQIGAHGATAAPRIADFTACSIVGNAPHAALLVKQC